MKNDNKEKSCFDLNQLKPLLTSEVCKDFIRINKMIEEIIKLKEKYMICHISYDKNFYISIHSYYLNVSDFLSELKDNFKIIDISGEYDDINERFKTKYVLNFWGF